MLFTAQLWQPLREHGTEYGSPDSEQERGARTGSQTECLQGSLAPEDSCLTLAVHGRLGFIANAQESTDKDFSFLFPLK